MPPHTNKWKTLTTAYHVSDGATAAIDPVNNLFVVAGFGRTYPSALKPGPVWVFSLSAPYRMQTWNNACDLTYRNGGLAWDSTLGLMVGYPGGGNHVYLLNTGSQDMVTPFGTVPSHKCLDVAISAKPSPVKGVDYPPDPEGTGHEANQGIFERFAYFPSLDVFVLVNNRGQDAWILRLTGKAGAP